MKPKAYTPEEVREMFLDQLRATKEYWLNETRAETESERMDGLVFSILNIIDGSTVGLPSFDLIPSPHEGDKDYLTSIGEKHFTKEVINNCQLHEHWYKNKK
jgi:hypothetical protein